MGDDNTVTLTYFPMPPETATSAMEVLRRKVEAAHEASVTRVGELKQQETTVFRWLIVAAVAALVVAVSGVVTVFTGTISVAAVEGAAALVSGVGSANLWRLYRSISAERDRIGGHENERLRMLEAVDLAFVIQDPKVREVEIVEMVRKMAIYAFPHSDSSTHPPAS